MATYKIQCFIKMLIKMNKDTIASAKNYQNKFPLKIQTPRDSYPTISKMNSLTGFSVPCLSMSYCSLLFFLANSRNNNRNITTYKVSVGLKDTYVAVFTDNPKKVVL